MKFRIAVSVLLLAVLAVAALVLDQPSAPAQSPPTQQSSSSRGDDFKNFKIP